MVRVRLSISQTISYYGSYSTVADNWDFLDILGHKRMVYIQLQLKNSLSLYISSKRTLSVFLPGFYLGGSQGPPA